MRKVIGLFCLGFLVMLAACAVNPNLTSKQSAYDVMAKFKVVQIAVERAVLAPSISPEAKAYLKLTEQSARTAVLAYADAVRAGADSPMMLARTVEVVSSLAGYLLAEGWLTETGWKGAGLWTPQALSPLPT